MADNIEQIKSRLDVVAVISDYLKLQKSGVNYKACCPFHNEKTPSFYVSPERQIWHCFGCSKGGDIFGFIKEIEGVEFPEALRILARKANVELEEFIPEARDEKERLFEIVELATKFFEKQLYDSTDGKSALKYLENRGLKLETIKNFRLGFAPNDWQSLNEFLRSRGYTENEVVASGLAIKKDSGAGIYDRFRSRIAFPIADINDRIVGFTGRVFEIVPTQESGGAKYINTPQTVIYDKSRVLYGLNKAKMQIKKAEKCLLVEGNMDAIMSHQAGVENVAASSGTALTSLHLNLLKRYTPNLDFCFDTDQAGAMATRRGIGLALNQGFNVKVVKISDPECKDPADYVKKYGEKWGTTVAESKPVIEFYFEKCRTDFDGSPEKKKSLVAVLAPLINRLASQVEKAHWVTQLAHFMSAPESAVKADLASVKDDLAVYDGGSLPGKMAEKIQVKETTLPSDILSETLLSIAMKSPTLFKENIPAGDLDYIDSPMREFVTSLALLNPENFNIDTFIKENEALIKPESVNKMGLEFAYLKSQELWKDFKDEELRSEFTVLVGKLKNRQLLKQMAQLESDIKRAEVDKDKNRVAVLATKFNDLAKELAGLQKNG